MLTGASGALASSVARYLNACGGYRVIALPHTANDTQPLALDVTDRNSVEHALTEVAPDVVLHLAGYFGGNLDEAQAVNVQGTLHLLETVERSDATVRVVLAGSAAEYGIVEPEANPIHETRVLRPVSAYGVTKAWQTQLACLFAARGLDVLVARIFNLIGEGLSERLFVGRVARQIAEIKSGTRATIEVGPLSAVRDYLPLDEAAEQIAAIFSFGRAGEIYHVASGQPVAMRDVLSGLLSANGLDSQIVREADHLSNRTGYDVPVIYGHIGKTHQLLQRWRARGTA
ncbi:NAD-dependent epimerase/dehydratase family protein [Caballeronia novacaledonica]|uniref:NAD-dependent epimerase/dehydratase family protein n=1 Tax=Caballeronia novacaledonica TaxID=1544861 RepID=A0ACB5R033_9BURK|nr:NAD-dependent epimerase/dehydratase family protein [Caballeronia novacaledonica]